MNTGTDFSNIFYNIEAHDINELEKNVEKFPFSTLARYMLLCHYKKTGHPDFEKLAQKTALYFDNQHWLQFQISQVEAEQPVNEFADQNDISNSQNKEDSSQNHFAVVTDELINVHQNTEEIISTGDEVIPEIHTSESHVSSYNEAGEENNNDFTDTEEAIPDSQTLGSHVQSYDTTTLENSEDTIEQVELVPETGMLGSHFDMPKATAPQNNFEDIRYASAEQNAEDIPGTQTLGSHQPVLDETQPGNENENQSQEIKENDTPLQNIESVTSPVSEPLAFEPMHTVDYFASQGIRISDELLSNDKLGSQMKSFTEWLKSMKKVHPEKLPEQNSLAENIIQSSAEVSNIDTEVLTEAMAEVLIKQDKKEKAVEMYNKLSLINPSKSAYFAAKIESIKST